jgi:hypothetical protein
MKMKRKNELVLVNEEKCGTFKSVLEYLRMNAIQFFFPSSIQNQILLSSKTPS